MFVVTAKMSKRKAVVGVLILAAVLCALVLIAAKAGRKAGAASPLSAASSEERISLLAGYGWEVEPEPIETQEIVIPRDFPKVYEDYNDIQLAQGFDLSEYRGLEATRYTYRILNYPGPDCGAVADIIVCRGILIAGDVQSASLDGFMHGLEYPKTKDANA